MDTACPFLVDLNSTFDAMTELLRLHSTSAKTRGKLQDRVAKAESDLKITLKKLERLEDRLKSKDKKIGEVENQMHRMKGESKTTVVKKKEEDVEILKVKSIKT